MTVSSRTLPSSKLTDAAEVAGILKQVSSAFTVLQVARNTFANTLQSLLEKADPKNVTLEALIKEDVMAVLCCPLVQDPSPGIQTVSLRCLGKLASRDPLLSQVVVSCGVLDSIVLSMSHENAPVQAAANSVLAAVGCSTVDFARRVLAAGVLPSLTAQLHKGPPAVQESAVRTLNSLVQSGEQHAAVICDDNMLAVLVALLQAKESSPLLCKLIVQMMGNTASFSEQLASALVKAQALPHLSGLAQGANTPADLRAAAYNCLTQVARHQEELAGHVAKSGVLQVAVQSLSDKMTPQVRRCAAAMLLELTRKTPDLAAAVTNNGAPACLLKYLQLERGGDGRRAGIMIAGQLSTFQASAARAVLDAGVATEVVAAVADEDLDICGAAAWALGQIAEHGADCVTPLIEQGALRALMNAYSQHTNSDGSAGSNTAPTAEECRLKLKATIKSLIRGCSSSAALEVFVAAGTASELLPNLLRRLKPLLKDSPKARQQYVTSGGLMRMQKLEGLLGAKGSADLAALNALFPGDVVGYYRRQE